MKLTQKKAGLGIIAVAVALLGTAALADKHSGPDGMAGPGMTGPAFAFAAIDANKDGKVTPDELTAWRKAQAAGIDTNADGKLSVDELAAMDLKTMTDQAKAHATEMVARLDTDGDGMFRRQNSSPRRCRPICLRGSTPTRTGRLIRPKRMQQSR